MPSILYAQQLNADESQMITQALTLLRNPVYWNSVDGTTIGPIASYVLIWPGLFGLPITYLSARLTGTLLIGLISWFLFAGFRGIISLIAARFGLLFLVLFFSYTTHFDFLHYSSELASLALVSAGWYCFLQFYQQTSFSRKGINWLLAGSVIGSVPYAKLQSVPSAALIAVGILASLYFTQSDKRWSINRRLLLFSIGLFFPTAFFVVVCAYHGILDRFYTFYIHSNLFNYSEFNQHLFPTTQLPLWERFLRLPFFFQLEATFLSYFIWVVILSLSALLILFLKRQPLSAQKREIGYGSIAWIGASVYSVIKPGTEFTHHLLMLVPPLGWMAGLAADLFFSTPIARFNFIFPRLFLAANLLFLAKTVILYQQKPNETNYFLHAIRNPFFAKTNPVSEALLHYAHPNDELVVWGWNMRYHVETQLPQGTSENHSFRSIAPHSLRKAYQDKYMEDIAHTQPAFFVDATGPNSLFMTDTAVYRHEKFAALAHYISRRYRLVDVVDQVRIYVRKDRLTASSTLRHPALTH